MPVENGNNFKIDKSVYNSIRTVRRRFNVSQVYGS